MKDNTFLWAAVGVAIAAILFVVIETAWGQTAISVDINRAVLRWQWAQGDGGPADEFLVKCGTFPKLYTRVTSVAPTLRELPVKAAITGSGTWYCVVSARNTFGESGATNEVPFVAGATPSSPTNAEVVAQ